MVDKKKKLKFTSASKKGTKKPSKVLVKSKFKIKKIDKKNITVKLDKKLKLKKKIKKITITPNKKLKVRDKIGLNIKKVIKKPLKIIEPKIEKIKQSKKIALKKEKKPENQNFVFSAESLFKAKIKVIGIGGGGGSIVSEIGKSLEKATFLIADTDIRALKKRNGIKHLCFGENLTHGLGTGVNVELARQAAEESKEKFKNIFTGQDIVIFIASLGGGLGSGATQTFIDAAKEFGGITLGIFTLPFKFEGKNKNRIAQNALKLMKPSLNVSLVIPNEKIFKVIDENTPITEAFSMVNKNLIGSLESLIDLIYNPGIINIDFADLKTILKGKGNQAFLNTIEEAGKERAEKTCDRIFSNPLLQNHSFVAENILFNIVGSDNLSMFEVEKISRHISELNPKAKIIFGISKNPKLKTKIKTTILMTGSGLKDNSESVKIPEVIIKKEEFKIDKGAKKVNNLNLKKPKKKKNNFDRTRKEDEVLTNNVMSVSEETVSTIKNKLEKKINITDNSLFLDKELPSVKRGTIRRSGLEIKKAEDQEEKKKMEQEKEWEIPAFLRRVKYKS
jgi:cell division protein FtsZ